MRQSPSLRQRADEEEAALELDGSRGRWLSINEACALLGVDQSTLRRWSDAGKVPVFRTPGGHRRYAEADLRSMVGEAPRARPKPKVTRQELTDRTLSAYEADYLRMARERRWFRFYSPATQEEHRRLGRRLVTLAIRFASAPAGDQDKPGLLDEGQLIGEHYGRAGALAGLTAVEIIEAFHFFRFPAMRAVMGLIEEEGLAVRPAATLFVEIGRFMDQVLVATVRAHQEMAIQPSFPAALAEALVPAEAGPI